MAKKKDLEISTVVIGVEPKIFDGGMKLSEEVRSRIPVVVDMILKES